MIRGTTALIAHIGWPTHAFKAPLIYNPYFEQAGIDAVVVPMGCRAEHYPGVPARAVHAREHPRRARHDAAQGEHRRRCSTSRRPRCRSPARATRCAAMPTADWSATCSTAKDSFAACAARAASSTARARWSSASAASARRSRPRWRRRERRRSACSTCVPKPPKRLPCACARTTRRSASRPDRTIRRASTSSSTRRRSGMNDGDPMPIDVARIASAAFVGEVVMKREMTAFLNAAAERGCRFQVGTDMLFEQIPAYLEFFGFPSDDAGGAALAGAARRLRRAAFSALRADSSAASAGAG